MNTCGDCKYFDIVQDTKWGSKVGSCENIKSPALECYDTERSCDYFEEGEGVYDRRIKYQNGIVENPNKIQ